MLFAALKDKLMHYYRRRVLLAFFIFVVFSAILFMRLFMLQVIQYESLSDDANRNRIKKREEIAERGFIYDRNMNILVSNTPSYDLVLNKEDIKKSDDIDAMLLRVAEFIDFDMDAVKKDYADRTIKSVLISRGLSLSDIAYFEEHSDSFLGLSIEHHSVRKYADGLSFSHILGYLSEVSRADIEKHGNVYKLGSQIGTMGIEAQYEDELRGKSGYYFIERDVRGRLINVLPERRQPAVSGNDLILTVDAELQQYIHKIMNGKKGAVIVMDIKDNSLLSLYSAPVYNLNMFTPYLNEVEWAEIHRDRRSPLINRTIEGLYSPGSVYKVAMALAGFEEKVVDKNTTFNCTGTFYYNSAFSYRCWKRIGHGKVNMRRALAESCDIYFYNLGLMLDINKMEYYSKILSLGELTGIDLPNEKTGIYPSRKWKKEARNDLWYPGDTINTSIGQGYMTSTPIQIAVMMSGVFNGGKIYKPHLLAGIQNRDTGTVERYVPELKYEIEVSKEIRDSIMAGLVDAVYKRGGTAGRARIKEMKIGGKTGTAQVVSAKVTERYDEDKIPEEYRDHAWFTGVFPARDPKYVIVVLAENSGGGGSSAAPIAGDVIRKMLDMGYVTKD